MQSGMLVKGMDSPRHIGISVRLAVILVATFALLNQIFVSDRYDHPRVTGLEVKLAGLNQPELGPELDGIIPDLLQARQSEHLRTVSVRLRAGETATAAIARVGADPQSTGMALTSIARMVDMRSLKPGQRFILELNDAGRVRAMRYPLNSIDYIETVADGDVFHAEKKELPTEIEVVESACVIRGSLYESFRGCGLDRELVPVVVDLLESQVDLFTEVRKGDTIRLVVQKESVNGAFVRFGRVEGLLLEGKVMNAGVFMHENADGSVSYFDAQGYSIQRPFSRNPIKYNGFTAAPSQRRLHPILHAYTPTKAVDYSVPRGTPVLAVGEGRVVFSGRRGASGNTVVIRHADGLQTYYAQLDSIRKGIRKGASVTRGTQIGTVGTSGTATNSHLHFAVARAGRFVKPSTTAEYPGVRLVDMELNDYLAYVGRMTGRLKSLPVRGIEAVIP